ncbi:hypothetical protein [Paenibacillus odorifer]|uniref:hypothetical protein n=1 Tax=Paenibacillus odorifer TaxID=189426 RepID=UPI0015C3DEA7|nr:hypothetical protein [Paenibacillus odorifer]
MQQHIETLVDLNTYIIDSQKPAQYLIDDYDLIDKDPEEFRRRGMVAYGITEDQLSVVKTYEIHSILTVNI